MSKFIAGFVLFCFTASVVRSEYARPSATLSSTGKPLVKSPTGRTFQTILSVDGGGLRGIHSTAILVEVENSIKRYLLSRPHLMPSPANISSIDDFDINLVDYFDCMTGISSGGWTVLYLASRGGQGAVRALLEKPDIVAKFGVIPVGGAEALRILFREFSGIIYPADTLDLTAGTPLDQSNPNAPGVRSPLYSLEGLESTLEAFYGNATLDDLDTSLLVPAYDLISNLGIYFVQNKFKSPSVTSSARLNIRSRPRSTPVNGGSFAPDLVFDEGKNYYLTDIGVSTGSVPVINPAKNVSQVGRDDVEFVMVDGFIPLENSELPTNAFVISENGLPGIERLSTLSIGTGRAERSFLPFANSGAEDWLGGVNLLFLSTDAGGDALPTLMDYFYYSNPNVRPNQFLRVQTSAPIETEEGLALSDGFNAAFLDTVEEIGKRTAQEYRSSIDHFVRDFIFG